MAARNGGRTSDVIQDLRNAQHFGDDLYDWLEK